MSEHCAYHGCGVRAASHACAGCRHARASSPNAITDIVWQWTTVTNKPTGEKTAVPNPQDYTITFRDDGTLSGKADCNTFTGTYTQEGGFFITAKPDVMAACGGDSLDQQYFELLDAIVAGGPDGAGGFALERGGSSDGVRERRARRETCTSSKRKSRNCQVDITATLSRLVIVTRHARTTCPGIWKLRGACIMVNAQRASSLNCAHLCDAERHEPMAMILSA